MASKDTNTNKDAETPTSPSVAAAPTPAPAAAQQNLPTAVEFEPPLACVRRILKTTLPTSTNVGKDASAAFARSAGIFIIYLTACANDFARENRRQTITANDVLAAVKELDFEEFTPKLQEFLETYRANEKRKKDLKAKAAVAKAEANQDAHKTDNDESKDTTPAADEAATHRAEEDPENDKGEKDDESTEEEGDATEEEDNTARDEEDEDEENPRKKRKMDDGDDQDESVDN